MKGKESALFEDFFEEELDAPKTALFKKRGLDNSTMGLKFPIWLAACTHNEISYKLTSHGKAAKGSAFIRLPSLSLASYQAQLSHQHLEKLSDHIVKYLQNFQSEFLQIPVSHTQAVHMCTCTASVCFF